MVENQYMTYGGNRLASVRDNATQLTYEGATDSNGEPNKEYPLTYNDAGRKIAKIDYDYLNNLVRIQFEEGYCQAEKNSSNASIDDFTFYYYDKDHLGNIRQVTKADGSPTGNVVQTINYYPFGMQFCDGTTCNIDQKHKYNGKEFDNMHGLNTYDYGARQYNPATARWDRMDPLCEKYYNISPYAYCTNNPIRFIDPDGKKVYVFVMKLPLSSSTVQHYLRSATHTFTVVKTADGKIYRYAYGPTDDKPIHSISGSTPIVERNYSQDKEAVENYFTTGKDNNTKNVVPVNVPKGMTESKFDNAVIKSAKQFRGNKTVMYRIIPLGKSEGNCNTSTTSLLENAGVDKTEIDRIDSKVSGIDIGFGSTKPWTKEQREATEARQKAQEKRDESLSNHIDF